MRRSPIVISAQAGIQRRSGYDAGFPLARERQERLMPESGLSFIVYATIVAGTPLIIAALGAPVTEKSGVLNLGAEGIMAVGAVAAFAITHDSGNPWLGVVAGMAAGALMSLIFGFLTLTLLANQ